MNTTSSENLSGQAQHFVFRNEDNGYSVARFKSKDGEACTIVGLLPGVEPGMDLRLEGQWVEDSRFGRQFKVDVFEILLPTDEAGMARYLGSGLISGLGPSYAKKIVKHFGMNTFEILDQNPNKLQEVSGIGPKKLKKIVESWQEQHRMRGLVVFLQQYGISPAYAAKVHRHYGGGAIEKIQKNPYQLAEDIEGIGFKKADDIAKRLGMDPESPARIEAALIFVLQRHAQSDGHACYPRVKLVEEAAQELNLAYDFIERGIEDLKKRRKIKTQILEEQEFTWLAFLYHQEQGIVRNLQNYLDGPNPLEGMKADWEGVCKTLKIELASQQALALQDAWQHKAQVLTGGPGTGKSTITKVFLEALKAHPMLSCRLAAPTGRAAKRLSEITGQTAQTLHSMLEYDFNIGFKRNRENPLEGQIFLVDEAGMLDIPLFYHLLQALPLQSKLILVGDVDQLPSVGPGKVLSDLIEAEILPVSRLTEIFRQAMDSKIITCAHALNQGQFPQFDNARNDDCFFLRKRETEDIKQLVLELVTQRLPQAYGFEARRDIQVLSPMRGGPLGTRELNRMLQKALIPNDLEGLVRGEQFWYKGDKVIQIRNNYDKGVFNGDIGLIKEIDREEELLWVEMDEERLVEYAFKELDNLELAYAVTIHKYQGSEAPCVVMPLHLSQQIMLTRNLLYTGLTRGRKLVLLVGQDEALSLAAANRRFRPRHTGLVAFWFGEGEVSQGFPPVEVLPLPKAQKAHWSEEKMDWEWEDN